MTYIVHPKSHLQNCLLSIRFHLISCPLKGDYNSLAPKESTFHIGSTNCAPIDGASALSINSELVGLAEANVIGTLEYALVSEEYISSYLFIGWRKRNPTRPYERGSGEQATFSS